MSEQPQRTRIEVGRRAGLSFSWLDVKLGVRMLGKQPLLTLVAVMALALGIPASLFPLHFRGALFAPLPVPDGDRIFGIRNWNIEENQPDLRALHDFDVWRDELSSFEEVATARSDPWNVHSEDGRAAPIRGAETSASTFNMLRVPPLMGRWLLESDEVVGATDVVVIGEDVWASRFARDPDIIGKTIRIGRDPHTVVGVMPEGFLFPLDDHLWLPLRANPVAYTVGTGPDLLVYGRLADGVSLGEARAELEIVGRRLAAEWPETHRRYRPEIVPVALMALGEPATGGTVQEIYLVQLILFVLLAVVCGNVGIMILARTATRTGEIALRSALGASQARILSQLFVESMVLAVIATGIGLVGADLVATRLETEILGLPYWVDFNIGPSSVLLALGVAAICAVGAGVLPAWKATGRRLQQNLQREAAGRSTVQFGAISTLLIVVEVALSVGFLPLGVVVARTVMQDKSGAMGIELDRYATAILRTPWIDPTAGEAETYLDDFWAQVRTSQQELKSRLATDQRVLSVAMGSQLPGTPHPARRVEVEGQVQVESFGQYTVRMANVDVDFFQDLGRPVIDGRAFSSADIPEQRGAYRSAVVVNTPFVEQVLGGGHAVGRRIRYAVPQGREPGEWYEIIGVVGPLGMNAANPIRDAGVYHPRGPGELHPIRYIIEVGDDPSSFVPRLRSLASEVDAASMIQDPRPVSELVAQSDFENQLASLLVLVLCGMAIVLSVAGLHAVMSFTVAQRTREIAVRTALGARPMSIIATVTRRALLQLMVGAAFGVWLGAVLLLELAGDSSIRPVSIPLVLAAVSGGVVVLGILASLSPTLRGLRVLPSEALRAD